MSIGNNKLSRLPEELGKLTHLTLFELEGNSFESRDWVIGELERIFNKVINPNPKGSFRFEIYPKVDKEFEIQN